MASGAPGDGAAGAGSAATTGTAATAAVSGDLGGADLPGASFLPREVPDVEHARVSPTTWGRRGPPQPAAASRPGPAAAAIAASPGSVRLTRIWTRSRPEVALRDHQRRRVARGTTVAATGGSRSPSAYSSVSFTLMQKGSGKR